MAFIVVEKPPRGTRGIRRVQKSGTKISNPRGHSIRQRCKEEKSSCLGNVVSASDRPLEAYLPEP
jgi:hypothetical protein